MGIAPNPQFPEKVGYTYERKMAPSIPANRGPLRFEEGVATDTDVPNDFTKGVMQGLVSAPGRPNHNANVFEKPAAETMQQRAHVGSAAWVEAPEMLGDFAHGAFAGSDKVEYEQVDRSNRPHRMNPAVVQD